MMGRAGRPQFDSQAFAVVLVHEPKKTFLKKFLYEPFPVESSLHLQLAHHLNAEIAAGTISSPQDAMDYLTWTFLFRRMLMNPGFYGITPGDKSQAASSSSSTTGRKSGSQPTMVDITKACSSLVDSSISRLAASGCITVSLVTGNNGENGTAVSSNPGGRQVNAESGVTDSFGTSGPSLNLSSTHLGVVASSYYLAFKTVAFVKKALAINSSHADIIQILSQCEECAELPLRFQEDDLNVQYGEAIAKKLVSDGGFKDREAALRMLGLRIGNNGLQNSATKAVILLFGHITRVPPPVADYVGDLKTILEQCWRLLQAILDISVEAGFAKAVENCLLVSQSLYQAQLPKNVTDDDAESRRLKVNVTQEKCEDHLLLSLSCQGFTVENAKTSANNVRRREVQWFVLVVDEKKPEMLLAYRRVATASLRRKVIQLRLRNAGDVRSFRITLRNDTSFVSKSCIMLN